MFSRYGGAAFTASVAIATAMWSCNPTASSVARPTFACFTSANANRIGRLGRNDGSVREAFETGACLALPPEFPSPAPAMMAPFGGFEP